MFADHQPRNVPAHPTLAMAIAIVLGLICSALLGANQRLPCRASPGLLPDSVQETARPIRRTRGERLAARLWQVIEEHADERLEAAVVTWQRIDLPRESAAWRYLGLGVAYLKLNRLNEAAKQLDIAEQLDPENAAVHYFRGLLRIELSQSAGKLSERPSREFGVVNRRRHELAAIDALELAIQLSPGIDGRQPVVPIYGVVNAPYPLHQSPAPPTVELLLASLGADNFVGKSHALLATLNIDRGRPATAELHVNKVRLQRVPVP